jgi:hypothetical protein
MTNWREYFRKYRQQIEDKPVEKEPETLILELGHEIKLTDLPKKAQKLAERLIMMNFEVKGGRSKTFHEGTVFLTGEKAGQKRPDKEVVHFYVQARHAEGYRFWGWWEESSFKGALCGEKGMQALIDAKQKERTGETLTAALERVLQDWEDMLNENTQP